MVSVYVVEQHQAVRQALVDWLGQLGDVSLVGSSGDIATARREIEQHRPQVVLLETKRADGLGMQLVSLLASLPDRPRILVLTSYPSDREQSDVLAAGAEAYVLKDIDTQELIQLILGS